jgi:1,4-alpha-glucan branching enzyme
VRTNVSLNSVGALVEGRHNNPFEILGPHEVEHRGEQAIAVRAFMPHSSQVWVVDSAHDAPVPMRRIHPAGLYEAICPVPQNQQQRRYRLRVANQNGSVTTMHDPYAFESLLTSYDLYLFGEGTHLDAYKRFGAQMREVDGVHGVNFSVWAPNATSVSVVGDFNSWDARRHTMRKLVPSGVWELFIPEIGAGETYKFRIKLPSGEVIDKSDPFGFAAELPPKSASMVADLSQYGWNDKVWMDERRSTNVLERPVSAYEVHLGSWRKDNTRHHGWMNYRELAHDLVEYCQKMGYTHLELLPVSEHPFSGSWGYQTVGYFAVTSRHGTPEDFMYFVDHCHQNDIGVILDWVPAHFPKDAHVLRQFDGTALYEHEDPRQGEHPDWGTLIFNYGRNEVRNFLLSNALFWLDEYHIDGLRVDAVASMLYLDYSREDGEWVPNIHGGRENLEAIDFVKKFNEEVHGKHPGVMTIAEESTAWGGVSRPTYSGGLGFTFKWNMGWMNDTLRFMKREPIHRRHHHNELTFSLIYAFTENFTLPLSHDEIVHGKGSLVDQMPGDLWQKFANLRLLYSYMWTHPGKKLLFMGSEFGQWNEWNHDAELQWDLLQWDTHRGLQKLVGDLNALYRREPSLYEVEFENAGFQWVECNAADDSVLIYMRKAKDPRDFLIVCLNFTPVVRGGFRIGVPYPGAYREVLNSDSEYYGGTNVGNNDRLHAKPIAFHGQPQSLSATLPPLGALVLKPA